IPSYRKRNGYTQALVTLTDAVTRKRRDYWLGEHDSPASRESYHRVIAEWEASGRRLPADCGVPGGSATGGVTIDEVINEYWKWAQGYYGTKHQSLVKANLRLLRKYFGATPAAQFGPNSLRLLRDEMIRGDPTGNPPRRPWSRKCINLQIQRIRHVFKWSA